MLYSLYDFDHLRSEEAVSLLRRYAALDLLDPTSKKLVNDSKFLRAYGLEDEELIKGLTLPPGKLSRTDVILYRFADALDFGRLISCSTFQLLLTQRLLSKEEEVKIRQGLTEPRLEDVLQQELDVLLNNTHKFIPWLENSNVLRFLRRYHYLPSVKGKDSLQQLNNDYAQTLVRSRTEDFNLALIENRLGLLDDLPLPALEDIALEQCRNLSALEYILQRIGDVPDNYLPLLYSRVLRVPGLTRLELLNSFYLTDLLAQIAQNEYTQLWQQSLLDVAANTDLETVNEYFLLLLDVAQKIPVEDIFRVFIHRGAYFYLGSIKLLDQLGGEKGRVIEDKVYFSNLPYLRDATLLANTLRKPENIPLLTEEILQEMVEVCASLKYTETTVCGSRSRVVIGMAMLDVILEEMFKRNITPRWENYIQKALWDGSASLVRYLLQLSGLKSLQYSEGLEDRLAPLAARQIPGQKNPFYDLDAEKVELVMEYVEGVNKEELARRAVADLEDNVQKIKFVFSLVSVKELVAVARAVNNYRTLFHLLARI